MSEQSATQTSSCNPAIATICTHNPQSERFRLFSGATIVEQRMCNGARSVSVVDSDRELTNAEWQEYCDRTIARRIVQNGRRA